MNRAAVLIDSIDRYAELCARLDDVFASRAATLSAAGLDEQAWTALCAQWAERLCATTGAAFAERFGDIYSATRRDLRAPALLGTAARDPRFVSTEAQPWRAEAARVSLDATGSAPPLEIPDAVPALRRIHEPPILPADGDATERTIEVPVYAQRPPVLPFQRARPISRRLHMFDTQTGLPLPKPLWIDDAGTPDPTKPT